MKDGICTNALVVMGAVAATPKISTSASEILTGINISKLVEKSKEINLACEAAAIDSCPIDDIRGTANYRKHLIKVLTKRAVIKAISRLGT